MRRLLTCDTSEDDRVGDRISAAYISVTQNTARHFSGRKEPADGAVCAVENVHDPVYSQAGRGQPDNRRADFGGIDGRLRARHHQFAVFTGLDREWVSVGMYVSVCIGLMGCS